MTLQQLEYIVALNKHRHFVSASKECGVAQPTLSLMLKKLEAELDIAIFDRSKQPIEPTSMGERIIAQAEKALREVNKIEEMIDGETNGLSGPLKIGVIPTLSAYLVPSFIQHFKRNYPEVDLTIAELNTESCIHSLENGKIDMFIAATPLEQDNFFEIPLYYERFVAYFCNNTTPQFEVFSATNMPSDNLWVLEEGHCLRDQVFNFCERSLNHNQDFEAGSIETLIKIIDKNGGYSVIPELHIPFLTEAQQKNIRIINEPPAVREISVVIRKDFIKERLINAVANTVKEIIPEHMLDERLKKFTIRL